MSKLARMASLVKSVCAYKRHYNPLPTHSLREFNAAIPGNLYDVDTIDAADLKVMLACEDISTWRKTEGGNTPTM